MRMKTSFGKRLRALLGVACLLSLPFLSAGCGQEGEEPLRMICEATFPPYEYRVRDGIDGIDPALCAIVAECLGRPLEAQDMAFDAVIPAVATGKADIAASGLTVTPERARQVRFSQPYMESAQVAVVRLESPIRAPADLHGRRIGVQSGSTGDLFVTKTYGEPERFQNVIFAATAALTGKVEASVVDRQPAEVLSLGNLCETGVDVAGGIVCRNQEGQIGVVSLTLHSKQPKRAVLSFDKCYVEIMEYPRADTATIVWTEDGRRETVTSGVEGYALCYEMADLERAVAGDARAAGLIDTAADVMRLMTDVRRSWGVTYPEEA